MKSPELYSILKLNLKNFIDSVKVDGKNKYSLNNDIKLAKKVEDSYMIKQQYNHLFRIIKNNKTIEENYIRDVLFIDCSNSSNYQKELDGILRKGVTVNKMLKHEIMLENAYSLKHKD